MALIKLGSLVTDIRGSIGGFTFSSGKAGHRVQLKPRGTRSLTPAQTVLRSNMGYYDYYWSAITDVQRAAWGTYAEGKTRTNSMGETYEMSGFNWWIMCNARLKAQGDAAVAVPPPAAAPDPLDTVILDFSDADNWAKLAFTPSPLGAAKRIVIFGSVVCTEGSIVAPSQLRLIYVSGVNPTTPLTFTNEIIALFGTILVNQRLFIVAYVSDAQGLRSTALADNDVS